MLGLTQSWVCLVYLSDTFILHFVPTEHLSHQFSFRGPIALFNPSLLYIRTKLCGLSSLAIWIVKNIHHLCSVTHLSYILDIAPKKCFLPGSPQWVLSGHLGEVLFLFSLLKWVYVHVISSLSKLFCFPLAFCDHVTWFYIFTGWLLWYSAQLVYLYSPCNSVTN